MNMMNIPATIYLVYHRVTPCLYSGLYHATIADCVDTHYRYCINYGDTVCNATAEQLTSNVSKEYLKSGVKM